MSSVLLGSQIPSQLLAIKNPPEKLYFQGNLELLNRPLVSVVGSRRASAYTKECVIRLCKMLSNSGVCVVSGGALGVDIAAHSGALPNTIAVFGNGLDIIYPKSNEKIIRQIYQNALAISEYEPKTPPLPYNFLQRNRLVVGLSKALVIAQADFKSGSMQSARLARQMGVPIFVLPQRVGESDGTNALLANGDAKILNDFEKFVELFGGGISLGQSDEILEFCKNGASLDDVLAKFGEMVYEYELLGKLEIKGVRVVLA